MTIPHVIDMVAMPKHVSFLNQGLPRIHLTASDTDTLARLFVDRTDCDFGGQVRYKQFMEAVGA